MHPACPIPKSLSSCYVVRSRDFRERRVSVNGASAVHRLSPIQPAFQPSLVNPSSITRQSPTSGPMVLHQEANLAPLQLSALQLPGPTYHPCHIAMASFFFLFPVLDPIVLRTLAQDLGFSPSPSCVIFMPSWLITSHNYFGLAQPVCRCASDHQTTYTSPLTLDRRSRLSSRSSLLWSGFMNETKTATPSRPTGVSRLH